jgi:hypothetical protein
MSKVLVKFEANYADEFDIYGFDIMEKSEWEDHLTWVNNITEETDGEYQWPIEEFFGTNEAILFYDYNEYVSCFTVVDITEEEVETIDKFFTTYERGNFLQLEY